MNGRQLSGASCSVGWDWQPRVSMVTSPSMPSVSSRWHRGEEETVSLSPPESLGHKQTAFHRDPQPGATCCPAWLCTDPPAGLGQARADRASPLPSLSLCRLPVAHGGTMGSSSSPWEGMTCTDQPPGAVSIGHAAVATGWGSRGWRSAILALVSRCPGESSGVVSLVHSASSSSPGSGAGLPAPPSHHSHPVCLTSLAHVSHPKKALTEA